MMQSTRFLFGVLLILSIGSSSMVVLAQSEESTEESSEEAVHASCSEWLLTELAEERRIYRDVQYAAMSAAQDGRAETSVLGTTTADTSDLVPYLVLNYRGLSCRLRMMCDAIGRSHGHLDLNSSMPHRPIGCSRLFAARGRWWSDERRAQAFATEPVPECGYGAASIVVPTSLLVQQQCKSITAQILGEEQQMLRLMVAQDAAHRGTRRVASVFQSVLFDVRDSFLEPLRGLADLFGSVIHPIPCLLTQCD